MYKGIYKRKPFTKEHRKKISFTLKGRIFTKKHRRKLSLSQLGPRNHRYGKHYEMSEEHKRKIGDAQIGPKNHMWKGGKVKRTCKICRKIFYVKPSQINYGGAKFCSHNCSSIWRIKHKKSGKTSIEIAIENELKKQCIPYLPQAPIENIALVDFLLPNKIIIQCDGIYWHSKPNVRQRDKKQDNILTSFGYKLFRFTDIEIEKSPKKCLEKIYGKLLSL